jgi:hypothetical protein
MYYFAFNCTQSNANTINKIIDNSREITRKTFLKHVNSENLKQLELSLGYAAHHTQGLTMAGECHVSYYKSKHKNKTVYYFSHSSIEYVFTKRI